MGDDSGAGREFPVRDLDDGDRRESAGGANDAPLGDGAPQILGGDAPGGLEHADM